MSLNTTTTSFEDLPHEMSVNIFLRLPVKSLIRSTSVNKKWYSLISNPNFVSSQIKHAISHTHDNAVLIIPPIISHQNYCSLVEAQTGSVIENYEIPFKTKSNSLKLIASVNGLVLLTDLHACYGSRDLYLWNPCVKRHLVLVSTCFKTLLNNRDRWFFIVGFGFNEASNDYRVVRIVYNMKGFEDVAPRVEIYSMKKHTWRKLKDIVVPRIGMEYGTYVKGRYYWLETKVRTEGEGRKDVWILSFDFDTEVFGEIKVPDEVSSCIGLSDTHNLMEFEGSLSLCVSGKQGRKKDTSRTYAIWLMRHENGENSWTLRFRAVLEKFGFPMNITKSGTLILESYPFGVLEVSKILSCNLNTIQYKDLGICKRGGEEVSQFLVAPCVVDTSFAESLVMFEGGRSLLKYAQ
ncbi:hypothetical protein AgCh_024393 [Apium graveolens]